MNRLRSILSCILTTALLSAPSLLASLLVFDKIDSERILWTGKLKGVLDLESVADTTSALVVGYNYFLLKRYATERGQDIQITLSEPGASYADSLKRGSVDIVVFPFGSAFDSDSLALCAHIDSTSAWFVRGGRHSINKDVNAWIHAWMQSEQYKEVRDSYLRRFDVFRSGKRERLSPYDEIIKAHADSAGVDWRLLAAIMYKESHFHIEARSHRGASGLMQMMPHTAKRFGAGDALDPESNIRAGAKLLGYLFRRYRDVGADSLEVCHYALAAYNAGIGRIQDCLNYAQHRGADTSHWQNIVELIPEMSSEDIMEKGILKIGPFKGVETIDYVESVMQIYNRLCLICPAK